jgi:ligand-binding sensor domain-containing protein
MTFRVSKFVISILFLLFTYTLSAADNPTVKYIGIEHGLSNNSVISAYKDYKGFMWFGTYDGLNRYDGYNFTVFRNRIGDSTSLKCNEVNSIMGDANHNIWIGGPKGISVYDPAKNIFAPATFKVFGSSQARQVTGNISNIILDASGNIFVSSEGAGLLVFEKNSNLGIQAALETKAGLSTNYRVALVETDLQSNANWIIINNVGLCRYDNKSKTIRLINQAIVRGTCFKTDGKGNLWFGTDDGLYKYNIATNSISANFADGSYKVSCICVDKKGVVWIGTDGRGIWLVSPGMQQATLFIN